MGICSSRDDIYDDKKLMKISRELDKFVEKRILLQSTEEIFKSSEINKFLNGIDRTDEKLNRLIWKFENKRFIFHCKDFFFVSNPFDRINVINLPVKTSLSDFLDNFKGEVRAKKYPVYNSNNEYIYMRFDMLLRNLDGALTCIFFNCCPYYTFQIDGVDFPIYYVKNASKEKGYTICISEKKRNIIVNVPDERFVNSTITIDYDKNKVVIKDKTKTFNFGEFPITKISDNHHKSGSFKYYIENRDWVNPILNFISKSNWENSEFGERDPRFDLGLDCKKDDIFKFNKSDIYSLVKLPSTSISSPVPSASIIPTSYNSVVPHTLPPPTAPPAESSGESSGSIVSAESIRLS